MMNYAKRGAALLLALVVCLGLLPPAGAEGDTITIHDASGLLKLAQSCTSDTWSQGVTVVLAADISLAGTGFSTIPVFRGRPVPHAGRGGCRKKSDSGRGSGPWRLPVAGGHPGR